VSLDLNAIVGAALPSCAWADRALKIVLINRNRRSQPGRSDCGQLRNRSGQHAHGRTRGDGKLLGSATGGVVGHLIMTAAGMSVDWISSSVKLSVAFTWPLASSLEDDVVMAGLRPSGPGLRIIPASRGRHTRSPIGGAARTSPI